MISDSVPWKEELEKVADRLERRKTQRRWTERTSFLVERDVMVSAYALRKLYEARKISDSLAAHKVQVTRCVLTGDVPDLLDRHSFWEHYDLGSGTPAHLTIPELCNQIIHSWVWSLSASESDEFDGIYVSSDRARKRELYFLPVDTLITLFRTIGSEDVTRTTWARGQDGQMRVVAVHADGEEPDGSGVAR